MTDSQGLRARWLDAIDGVAAPEWNALVNDEHPFVRHEFLAALEQSGSIRAELGWQPEHLLLYQGDALVAAAPCYRKRNSHGEFIFDWHWAQAYESHRLAYYPKLLVGVPYTPVTGPRLLARPGPDAQTYQRALIAELRAAVEQRGYSSLHVNFLAPASAPLFAHDPWLPRADWQFHWQNPGYRDFKDFLDQFRAKKRKNILQERARVHESGVTFRISNGHELDSALIKHLHGFYLNTFEEKGNTPALSEDFFVRIARSLPTQFVAIMAFRAGQMIAAALLFRSKDQLFGRHWGSREELPGLHFETCYYQGIEYAIREQIRRFEPGAQGEHKIARGFLPVRTRSAHYISHPGFRSAIRNAIDEEWRRHRALDEIYAEHNPFRKD